MDTNEFDYKELAKLNDIALAAALPAASNGDGDDGDDGDDDSLSNLEFTLDINERKGLPFLLDAPA